MIEDGDNIIDCMARMVGDNTPFALATVVRTEDATAAKAGAKAVVRADGALVGWIGGTCAEGPVRKAAAQALVDGRPRLIRVRPAEQDVTWRHPPCRAHAVGELRDRIALQVEHPDFPRAARGGRTDG